MPAGQSEPAPSILLSTSDTPPGAADSRGETLSSAAQLQSSAASTYLDRPPLPANLSTLSASARTSYTRVDLSNMDSEVPPRGDNGDEVFINQDVEEGNALDGPGVESAVPDMPQVSLTFLLVSGRRRTMSFDHEMTVGRVKELVWNAWPNEWQDERPPAPSYLRILYLGKILQDDDTLTKVGFASYTPSVSPNGGAQGASRSSTPPPSTIVHLSIRAYAPPAQDAPKKKSRRQRQLQTAASGERTDDAEEQQAGCCGRCIVC
ncbi:hypothetical protein EIP91_006583 [Steccherinum ochraceum]|uniref:Ubiquitin-like domain-containing protein n=1 Tax=Steccherinum ochraceum TaxID=92696 RepID=A0A4R0R5G9_9APHY|nr:hypothetical protein EIP91_006583 [Steccherinum ochraceum]